MPVEQLEDLFNHGVDVLGTSQDDKGTISAQLGDVVAEDSTSDGSEWWQHVGFASRPAKCDPGSAACQAVTINRGRADLIIATRDLRGSGVYGTLRDGETCLYAPGPHNQGQAKVLLQDDGTTATITITVGGSTSIVVKSDGSITISGGPVNLAGAADFAALAAKVDENFSTLSSAISAATCPGGSGGPLRFAPPSLPSVAASEVKIS